MTEAEKTEINSDIHQRIWALTKNSSPTFAESKAQETKAPDSLISIVVWNVHLQSIYLSESSGESCDVCERAFTHLVL